MLLVSTEVNVHVCIRVCALVFSLIFRRRCSFLRLLYVRSCVSFPLCMLVFSTAAATTIRNELKSVWLVESFVFVFRLGQQRLE